MKIVWTPEARQDRFEIWARIARDDPYAAIRIDERFGTAAAGLGDHPELGREGLIPGTREFVVHESEGLCLSPGSSSRHHTPHVGLHVDRLHFDLRVP